MRGEENEAVIRRLNRTEYQYTMEDLLGLKMNYINGLASDPLSPDGFLTMEKLWECLPCKSNTILKQPEKPLD